MSEFQPRVLVTGGGLGIGCSTVEYLLVKYNARAIALTIQYGVEMEALLMRYGGEKKRLFVVKGDVTSVRMRTFSLRKSLMKYLDRKATPTLL